MSDKSKTGPPFRADHVGSLLRSARLQQARANRENNQLTSDALRAIEDEEIRALIERQQDLGLRDATDGEFRRSMWHVDFLERLDGGESFNSDHGLACKGGVETKAKACTALDTVFGEKLTVMVSALVSAVVHWAV